MEGLGLIPKKSFKEEVFVEAMLIRHENSRRNALSSEERTREDAQKMLPEVKKLIISAMGVSTDSVYVTEMLSSAHFDKLTQLKNILESEGMTAEVKGFAEQFDKASRTWKVYPTESLTDYIPKGSARRPEKFSLLVTGLNDFYIKLSKEN